MRTGRAVSLKGRQSDGGLQIQLAAAGRMVDCFGEGRKRDEVLGYGEIYYLTLIVKRTPLITS